MTTSLFLRNSATEAGANGVAHWDLSTDQGTGEATVTSPDTQNTAFSNVSLFTFRKTVNAITEESATWPISVEVASFTGSVSYRFRLERRSSDGTTVESFSAWSSTLTTSGVKFANLAWTSGTWSAGDQLVFGFDYFRNSGHGAVNMGVSTQDVQSVVTAQYTTAGPATITAVVASATADAPVPVVAAGAAATVTAIAASATADAPIPTVIAERAVTISGVVGSATADVPAPTIAAGGAATITAVAASATADAPVPLVEVEQIARPTSDANIGGWTTDAGAATNLFQAIDEPAPASDADYIQSPVDPAAAVYVCQLSGLSDPARSDGHQFRYRYRKDGTATIDLTVELRQDYTSEGALGTLIADWVHAAISDTEVTAMQPLADAEADAITNYGALAMRFVANRPA